VISMEVVERFTGILEVFGRLLACAYVAVPGPLNMVVQLPVTLHSVAKPSNFPILRFIDYHCISIRAWLSYHRRCIVIELQNVEDFVIQHSVQQRELVSILVDDHTYCLRSSDLVV